MAPSFALDFLRRIRLFFSFTKFFHRWFQFFKTISFYHQQPPITDSLCMSRPPKKAASTIVKISEENHPSCFPSLTSTLSDPSSEITINQISNCMPSKCCICAIFLSITLFAVNSFIYLYVFFLAYQAGIPFWQLLLIFTLFG